MSPLEQRATFTLSLIVSLRMLGLMMVLPLFALSATEYTGANPSLIGLALGAYGLTQAILQIPLGMLSDRIGRKPVMAAGLLVLAIGSIVAATGHSITSLMVGRVLQGGGAIGSTAIACLADLTHEDNRSKAMAILGISIGLSFFLAMTLGPLLNAWMSLSGIFWTTALFAFAAIGIVYWLLPAMPIAQHLPSRLKSSFLTSLKIVLTQTHLLQLNFGVFLLHAISTASFIAIPVLLQQTLSLSASQQWQLYLPVLCIAFVIAFTFIVIAEKKRRTEFIFLASIAILGVSEFLFYLYPASAAAVISSLLLSLTVFSILEAILPSLASKIAPAESKGATMGIFSSSQFLGIFAGGALGGWVDHRFGVNAVFLFCTVLALIWLTLRASSSQKHSSA